MSKIIFMKGLKIYLWVVSVLLIVAIGFGVYVWYTFQKIQGAMPSSPEVSAESRTTGAGATPSTSDVTRPTTTETINQAKSVPVAVSDLNTAQQQILNDLGYTQGTLTITPAMIACAEDAVGNERLGAILKGGAPTPLESLKLLPCFKV